MAPLALIACSRFASAVLACALAGCASSTYEFQVDSIKNEAAPSPARQASYRIVSANPDVNDADLRVQQAARFVKTALSSKGMFEAPEGTEPDVVIEVDFGIEAPRAKSVVVSEPVIKEVGGGTRVVSVPVTNSATGFTVMVQQTVTEPSRQEIIGYRERVIQVTVYEKYLRIAARETPEEAGDRPPRELWSVYVTNDDESADLERYLPLLVSAAMDSIDENASARKIVQMGDDDERVVFVAKGM